jgi:AraC-like DNA-binding protein
VRLDQEKQCQLTSSLVPLPDTPSPFAISLFPFVAGTLTRHRNPATCILAGVDGPITVRSGREQIEGDILLIRPGVDHEVDIDGRARVLYFDGLAYPLDARLACRVPPDNASMTLDALAGDTCAQMELRARFSRRHPWCPAEVAGVVSEIGADPMIRMDQAELARRLRRSRTHSLRMFKAITGMTFRAFKQWTALCAAARSIADGALVRTSAMDAGFADTAHLTRTFRASFGITPTLATADRRGPSRGWRRPAR